MKINKFITIVLLVAFGYTTYVYTEEQKKINTYYFINENIDFDATICKVSNNNNCLTTDEYIILKADNKVYAGLSKDSNDEFKVITNEEYHNVEWNKYKMPNENNTRILIALMILEFALLIIYIYELVKNNNATIVNKYGTEE